MLPRWRTMAGFALSPVRWKNVALIFERQARHATKPAGRCVARWMHQGPFGKFIDESCGIAQIGCNALPSCAPGDLEKNFILYNH
jgi:hypothetical protein